VPPNPVPGTARTACAVRCSEPGARLCPHLIRFPWGEAELFFALSEVRVFLLARRDK